MSKTKFLLFVMFGLLFFSMANSVSVFADVQWGTGGTGGNIGYGGNTGALNYFNCYSSSRCPRWIKVAKTAYDELRRDTSRHVGSYSLPECAKDNYVIIAGSQDSDGGLIMFNKNEGYWLTPHKTSHIYVGEADSRYSVWNYNCYSSNSESWCLAGAGNPDSQNFFSQTAPRTGKTYSQVLKEVISLSGYSENNLAAFCESMLIRDEIYGAATAGEISADTNPNTSTEPSMIDSVDTGWTQTTMTRRVYRINDCPATGCLAKLGLYIKWQEGNTDVSYKVRAFRDGKWTNWQSAKASKPDSGSKKVKGLYDDEVKYGGQIYRWGIEKLYPGQSVCYELEFLKNADLGDPIYVTSCVVAGGASTKSATLNLKVKNEDAPKYQEFQDVVYAKPGDKITYQTTYNPAPQDAYSLAAPQVVSFNCKSNSNPYLFYNGQLGNLMTQRCGSWKNAFNVQRKTSDKNWNDASEVAPAPYSFEVGSTNQIKKVHGFNQSTSRIANNSDDVGKEYNDRSILNVGNASYTPSEIKTVFGLGNFVENIYLVRLASSSNATLDVESGGGTNENPAPDGQKLILWSQHGAMNQQWLIQKRSDGYYTLTSMNSGKALDVNGASPKNGLQLQVWTQNDTCAQKWEIVDHQDGTYSFLSACNKTYAIDATGGSSADGTKVETWTYHGGSAQRWKLIPLNNTYNSVAEIKTDQVTSNTATVRVPYNFKNRTTITTEVKTPLYAGEVQTFTALIETLPRQNNTTGGNYATIVPEAKHKFEICYGNDCEEFGETNVGALNSSSVKTGDKKARSDSYVIRDVPAGTEVCVRSAIWPANSGAETNFNNKKGSDTWDYSSPVCFKVAKKPSLQVWGGNIYSAGDIKMAIAKKTDTKGYDGTHVFGSWGELGIIANGKVKGLASGAGMGYSDLDLVHKPGGSTSTQFCDSSTLSFANYKCSGSSGYVGEISSISIDNPASKVINKDRNAILRKFGFKDGENNSNILYNYEAGDYEIGAETIDKSVIQVYQSDETIKIVGDMVYEDVAYSFTKNGENKEGEFLPKLIIMAKNIDIDCHVERIDGVLIAESTVTTSKCDGSEDINASVNSHPLTINGAVLASKITANRTYGAGVGDNSMISAETINFDPSLYLWGELGTRDTTGNGESIGSGGKRNYLDVTYIRELAPRY